jgi:hypothetical protein
VSFEFTKWRFILVAGTAHYPDLKLLLSAECRQIGPEDVVTSWVKRVHDGDEGKEKKSRRVSNFSFRIQSLSEDFVSALNDYFPRGVQIHVVNECMNQ